MNRILKVDIKDNRVYVKVAVAAIHEITLRFYVTGNKPEFLAHLSRAINIPLIESPAYGRSEDNLESFEYCYLVEGTMEILRSWGFTDYILTGMYNPNDIEKNKYKVTGPGKAAHILYMNIGGFSLDPLEVFLSYEESALRMIQWNTRTNFINWQKRENQQAKKYSDIIIQEWLHCIDNLSELLMFKCLCNDQIKYLVDMRLISIKY